MLKGHIDVLNAHEITGWAQDSAQPETAVSLLITDNDILVGRVLANRYRADLEQGGVGDGRHGFGFEFPVPLTPFEPHVIRIRNEADGGELRKSPLIYDATKKFDAAAEQFVSSTLAQCGSDEDIPRKIEFLVTELDRLMRQLADCDCNRAARGRYRRLLQRWAPPQGEMAEAGATMPAPVAPQVLVIDDRLPKANRDAGSNAILSHIQSLQRLGYRVTLVPSADFAPEPADCAALEATGLTCCCAPFYGSVEEVLRRQAGEFDIVYFHRVANAVKYGELVRQYFPRARRLFSVADLHHVRLARQAQVEGRPELDALAKRTRFAEFLAAATADAVITHSTFEAQILRAQVGAAKVHIVPWAVAPRPTAVPFSRRRGMAFIGGFGHAPNRDAVRWLASEIMPLVRKRDPAIDCLLVGSEMAESERLAGDGLVAIGQVKDLAEIFDRVRLTVAPLAYGAGIKGKVLESFAAGIPCVYTPVAAEGLDLPAPLRASIADDAVAIAEAVHRLHEDEAANAACRQAGLDYVGAQLSEARIDDQMRQALGLPPSAAASRGGSTAPPAWPDHETASSPGQARSIAADV